MKAKNFGKVILFLVLAMLTTYMAAASVFIDNGAVSFVSDGTKLTDAVTTQSFVCQWTAYGDQSTYKTNVTITKNGVTLFNEKDLDSKNNVAKQSANTVDQSITKIGDTFECAVIATDASTSVTNKATVVVKNQAPKFTANIGPFTVSEDSGESVATDISGKVTDNDGSEDTLTFSISSEDVNKVDCAVSADGKALTFKPAADFSSTDAAKCKVLVKDNAGVTDEKEFSVTVNNVNDAPAFNTAQTLPAATVNQSYTVTISANDKDANKLTFSVDAAAPSFVCPNGVNNCFSSITDNSVALSFTPTQEGTFNFKISVTDGLSTTTQTFALTVGKAGTAGPSSSGSNSKLVFKDIDAYVDVKKEKDVDETGGTVDEVRPGSKLKIRVEVENLWPDSEKDHDISDVEVEVELEDVGGDSDQEDETLDFKDLDPGDDDFDEVEFKIANDAEEGTYDLTLTLTGTDDKDNTRYQVNKTISVKVEKENHMVDFTKFTLSPSTISCSRTTKLSVEVTNLGDNDEDVQLLLKQNKELGINENLELFKLEEGDVDEDDTQYKKEFTFNIPTNVKAGPYAIEMEVYYNDDEDKETESAILVVAECGGATPTTTGTQATTPTTTQPEKKTTVEVVTPSTQPSTQVPVTTPVTTATLPSQSFSGFFDGSGYVVLLVVAIIVVIVIIIFLLVAIARRRD
ncbi:hypothetical protein HZA96_06930 [Candidatus Woesearchaeota archaeon]|nr:hypothetical protein [Candidatus Woesearchaeota archaeon]